MSRISQSMAESIAKKMTTKSSDQVSALLNDYRQCVTDVYKAQLPSDVLDFYKKYPEFTQTSRSVYLNTHGFHYEQVTLTERLPDNRTDFSYTAKDGANMIAAKRKLEKAQKDLKDLRIETEQALLALKTFNNIRKELPQAAEFLPPPMSNALVVNFDSLHKKLKAQEKLPTVAKETVTN